MVFYAATRRSKRYVSKQNISGCMTDLPDEVLLKILPDLDAQSILNFRLSCKHVVQSCNTAISKQVTTLYLHPRTIERAVKICQHPIFNQGIEELVILGKVQWREIEKAFPRYRKYGRVDSHRTSDRKKYRDVLFRSWPAGILGNSRESYQDLLGTLATLPKLRKLSFAESISGCGWSQSTQAVIDAHAHRSGDVSYLAKHETPLSDAEVFYGLLLDERLQFNSILLDADLPFTENPMCKLSRLNTVPDALESALGTISSLAIRVDCGWNYLSRADMDPYFGLLQCTRESLKQLKISLTPNLAFKVPKLELRLDVLLGLTFPRLEALNISLDSTTVSPSGESTRMQRPICQQLDIEDFLSRHSQSLTTFMVKNVMFSCYNIAYCNVLESIRKALYVLERSNTMQSVEWLINRYVHEPRCQKGDDQFTDRCQNFQCDRYDPNPNTMVGHLRFELLARELGVKLDDAQATWDFGQALMMP